jgi:hypothetical protein
MPKEKNKIQVMVLLGSGCWCLEERIFETIKQKELRKGEENRLDW